jgi:putative restriction endonuclease
MRYEGYDLTTGEGLRVWHACTERASALEAPVLSTLETAVAHERFGNPVVIRPRLGQGVFRLAVTDAYGGACAITHEHSLPALEAAHIKPYGEGGEHEIRNGLLLRSDLHRLFDTGYLTVTPEHRLEVSLQLREHFSNGRSYYPLHGSLVAASRRPEHRADRELLRWHNEHVFRG